MLYALAAHYTRRRLGGVTPIAVATGSLIAATVLTLPFGAAFWPVANPSVLAWACAVALGIGCTALAYLLYFRLIARLGAVAALAVTYLIPVFGVTWGAIFLDERLPASAFTGALLVLAGVALTTRAPGDPGGQPSEGALERSWYVVAYGSQPDATRTLWSVNSSTRLALVKPVARVRRA